MAFSEVIVTHSDSVYTVSVSGDGSRIASGSRDGVIQVVSSLSGDVMREMVMGRSVVGLSYERNDRERLSALLNDGTVVVWAAGNSSEPVLLEHQLAECCAFSPEGMLFTAGHHGRIIRWDSNLRPTESMLDRSRIIDLSFFGTPATLVATAADTVVYFVDPWSLNVLHQIDFGSMAKIYRCRSIDDQIFCASVQHMVAGREPPASERIDRYEITLWNERQGEPPDSETCLVGHAGWIGALAVAPDASVILSGAADHAIRLWDPRRASCVASCREHDGFIYDAAFIGDGSRFVTCAADGTVRVWPTESVRCGKHPDTDISDISETLLRIASKPPQRGVNWLTVCGQQIVEYCLSRRTEPAIDECIDAVCNQLPYLPIAPASMILLVDNMLDIRSRQALREGDESTERFCDRARHHFVDRMSARIASLDQIDETEDDQAISADDLEASTIATREMNEFVEVEEGVQQHGATLPPDDAAAARAPLLATFERAMDCDDLPSQEAAARALGDLALSVGRLREAKSWLDKSSTMARASQHCFGLVQDVRKGLQIAHSLTDDKAASRLVAELDQLQLQWGHVPSVGLSAPYDAEAVASAKAKLEMSPPSDGLPAQSTYDASACADHYVRAKEFRQAGKHEQAIDAYRAALLPIVHIDSQLANQIDCLNGLGIAYRLLAWTVLSANQKLALAELTANRNALSDGDEMSFVYQSLQRGPLDLALKARACHRIALENYKLLGKLSGQANQLSNLALVEELLGNIETAWQYQFWALQTHSRCAETHAADIDSHNLQRLKAALCKE